MGEAPAEEARVGGSLFPEVRVFFAVEPSVEALQAVLVNATALRDGPLADAPLRWANPAGWHVTTAFVGSVDVGLVPALRDVLGSLAPRPRRPELRFDELLCFPEAGEARFLVRRVGGAGVDALACLERELAEALASVGVVSERSRPYVPHLTLARARNAAFNGDHAFVPVAAIPWQPLAVTLFESRPEAGRRRYVPLSSVAW